MFAVCVVCLCVALSMGSVYQLNKCLLREGMTNGGGGPQEDNEAPNFCVCVFLFIFVYLCTHTQTRLNKMKPKATFSHFDGFCYAD